MKPSEYFKKEMNKLNEEFTYEIGVLDSLDERFIDKLKVKDFFRTYVFCKTMNTTKEQKDTLRVFQKAIKKQFRKELL